MDTQQTQQYMTAQEECECDLYVDEISAEELWAEIDQKARQYFDLSGKEFARQYRHGMIPDTFASAELGFLLRCVDDSLISA